MGVIITPQAEIDKYFESDRVSQSVLKDLAKGFNYFVEKQLEKEENVQDDKENKSFLIGSAVDCILTGEEGEFEKQYYVSQLENKPSDTEMNIVKMVFDYASAEAEREAKKTDVELVDIGILADHPSFIISVVDKVGWQPRWKPETKINKIIEVGSDYFIDLAKAYGKTILSASQRFIIEEIVVSLKNNSRTAHYFDRDMLSRSSDVDVYYQLPIYFKYKGVDCKALLDILLVFKNPETRQIEHVQPLDLKTMHGNTTNFLYSVKQWRYDIQSTWYTLAIRNWLNVHFPGIEVIIKDFLFIVESTSKVGTPLVYKLDDQLLSIGKNGRDILYASDINQDLAGHEVVLSKEIRGYESLIDEYIYYAENGWNEEKVVTENESVITIDWNGIK